MKRAALVMAVEVLLPLRNECEGDGGMVNTQLSVSRMLNLSGRDSNVANDCDGGVCVKRQDSNEWLCGCARALDGEDAAAVEGRPAEKRTGKRYKRGSSEVSTEVGLIKGMKA